MLVLMLIAQYLRPMLTLGYHCHTHCHFVPLHLLLLLPSPLPNVLLLAMVMAPEGATELSLLGRGIPRSE